jgi:UPF0716 family protein affecting phage T7 exclusion
VRRRGGPPYGLPSGVAPPVSVLIVTPSQLAAFGPRVRLESGGAYAVEVVQSPAIGSIAALGVGLLVIFMAWLFTAQALYESLYGYRPVESLPAFLSEALTTSRGWTLIILGNLTGFVFAAVVLAISVISFPLLLDRDVGVAIAVQTSVRAVLTNPVTMALWGLIVAGLLALGFATLIVGLAIVVPVLGHATWHLYRRVVERDSSPVPAVGKAGSDYVRTTTTPPRREQEGNPGQIDPDLAAEDAPSDRVPGEDLNQRQEKLIDEAVEETYPASDPIAPKRIMK